MDIRCMVVLLTYEIFLGKLSYFLIKEMRELIINGEKYNYNDHITISNMLQKFNLNKDNVVVEVNYDIIDKLQYDTFFLKDEDNVEVISFVRGG